MSDVRKCDGPGCDKSAGLGGLNIRMWEYDAENYITLERRGEYPLHFHNQKCLTNWTKENVK